MVVCSGAVVFSICKAARHGDMKIAQRGIMPLGKIRDGITSMRHSIKVCLALASIVVIMLTDNSTGSDPISAFPRGMTCRRLRYLVGVNLLLI